MKYKDNIKNILKEYLLNDDPFKFLSLSLAYKEIVENNILQFDKFVKNYRYKTLEAKFYPGEFMFLIYEDVISDIKEKKLASIPHSNFKFSYFLHLTKIDNKFILRMYIPNNIPNFIQHVFLEYSKRNKLSKDKDFKKSQEFLDFVRKYIVFFKIYDGLFSDKKISIKEFLNKCKKCGLSYKFVKELLEILKSDKIILLDDDLIMLKNIENFGEVTFR